MDTPHELYDLDAEQATLGAMLIDPDAIAKVNGSLLIDDFHDGRNQRIFNTIQKLHDEGTPPDFLVVSRRLLPDDVPHLSDVIATTPSSMHVRHYAQIVSRLGTLRRLMGVAGDIAKLAYNTGADARLDAVFDRVRKLVNSAAPMESDKAVLLWLDSLSAFYDFQLERKAEIAAMERGEITARATFPWKALQKTERGGFVSYLRPGTLVIVAADTSVGKTVFMECCAEHWARLGLQVAFFHLELPHSLMIDRRMCRHSGESLLLTEGGEITTAMEAANIKMLGWAGGVHYIHCPGWSASRIVAKARQMRQRGLCDVVIVDYLQKLTLGYRNGINKADALGNAAEGIKNALEQMGIPGLMGSQFNRKADEDHRKRARRIKGSGDVEDKANLVITLDREILDAPAFDEYGNVLANKGDRSPRVVTRVDKNTNGPTGDTELIINGARFLILDRAAPAPVKF